MKIAVGISRTSLILVLSFLTIADILTLIYLPLYSYRFIEWETIYLLDPFYKETRSHISWIDFYNPPILFIILYLISTILPFRLVNEKMRLHSFKSVIVLYVAFPILFFNYIFLVPFFMMYGRTNFFPIVPKILDLEVRLGPAMIILTLTTIFRIIIELKYNIKNERTKLISNSENRFFVFLTFFITYTPVLVFYIHSIIWYSWIHYPARINNELISSGFLYSIANARIFFLSSVFGGILGISFSPKNYKLRKHTIIIMKSILLFLLVKLLLSTFYGLDAEAPLFNPTAWDWWGWITGGWVIMYILAVLIFQMLIFAVQLIISKNNKGIESDTALYPTYDRAEK